MTTHPPAEMVSQRMEIEATALWRRPVGLLAALAAALLSLAIIPAASRAAGAPQVDSTGFSHVTETSAVLEASVDPNGAKVKIFRFEYQAESSSFGAGALSTPAREIPATVKGSGDLQLGSALVTGLATSAGTFGPGQAIEGEGIPSSTTIVKVTTNAQGEATELTLSHAATQTASSVILTATGPQPVSAPVGELKSGTTYYFRAVAENAQHEKGEGPTLSFATVSAPPLFGACPNDVFRSGELAPSGQPSASLPDCRAFEQVSPTAKNGGDVTGNPLTARSSPDGTRFSFFAVTGIPGGEGAEELPFYLASRSSDWQSEGLLAPPGFGQRIELSGWTPDFSTVFEKATKFGEPLATGLLARSGAGSVAEATPYTGQANYWVAGATEDGSELVFEATKNVDPSLGSAEAAEVDGHQNVYVWDRATGQIRLLSVENDGSAASPKGSFAGPYDWVGSPQPTVNKGGAARDYYLQDEHAVSADGNRAYFTAAGGQLYLRQNPAEPQSAIGGGQCSEPGKACTHHVSASQRPVPDPAGTAPAAFQGATADGSAAFFTSPEKLTAEATTGPEQPAPFIGRANKADGSGALPEFLETAAAGLAVSGGHIYWANPGGGTIGRAALDGSDSIVAGSVEPDFIVPGQLDFEVEVEVRLHEFETQHVQSPSRPQYVAVDAGHVYWSDATDGKDEHGTIGRAALDGSGNLVPGSVEPEFITNASNPQGIGVNSEYVFWANSSHGQSLGGIGRADILGEHMNQRLILNNGLEVEGLAVDASHVYWGEFNQNSGGKNSTLDRADLNGENETSLFLGQAIHNEGEVRGVAVDAGHVYWVERSKGGAGHGTIERADLDLTIPGALVTAEGSLKGLAVDNEHLFWSADGEVEPNPGNDLYRYDAAGGDLTDLVPDPDPADPNGAEVQGVLGISGDGSYVYFAANAALPGTGAPGAGSCHGEPLKASGVCNLYLLHGGQLTFIAQLELTGNPASDVSDWLGTSTSGGLVPDSNNFGKSSRLAAGGEVLVFRSRRNLTGYDSHGVPEFYRYRAGASGLRCMTCIPTGAAPAGRPRLGSLNPPALPPEKPAATLARNLSADGSRFFFESPDQLVAADTDGQEACPLAGSEAQQYPSCLDVYEWEAPGSGSCTESPDSGYVAGDGGCLNLISTGKEDSPALFADASESGDDVFFYTRQALVGQDGDQLFDVYDARAGGGIAGQNERPLSPCEGEAGCRPPLSTPPAPPAPASGTFVGPGNQATACPKGKVHRGGKCVRKAHKPRHHRRGAHHRAHHHKHHGRGGR